MPSVAIVCLDEELGGYIDGAMPDCVIQSITNWEIVTFDELITLKQAA